MLLTPLFFPFEREKKKSGVRVQMNKKEIKKDSLDKEV